MEDAASALLLVPAKGSPQAEAAAKDLRVPTATMSTDKSQGDSSTDQHSSHIALHTTKWELSGKSLLACRLVTRQRMSSTLLLVRQRYNQQIHLSLASLV